MPHLIRSLVCRLERVLGEGAFGQVYLGEWISRRDRVAVKKLHAKAFTDNVRESFLHEAAMMQAIKCSYVLGLLGVVVDEKEGMALVLEYCERKSLFDVLHSKQELPWRVRLRVAEEAAKGLLYLHKMKPQILHRDLKVTVWLRALLDLLCCCSL